MFFPLSSSIRLFFLSAPFILMTHSNPLVDAHPTSRFTSDNIYYYAMAATLLMVATVIVCNICIARIMLSRKRHMGGVVANESSDYSDANAGRSLSIRSDEPGRSSSKGRRPLYSRPRHSNFSRNNFESSDESDTEFHSPLDNDAFGPQGHIVFADGTSAQVHSGPFRDVETGLRSNLSQPSNQPTNPSYRQTHFAAILLQLGLAIVSYPLINPLAEHIRKLGFNLAKTASDDPTQTPQTDGADATKDSMLKAYLDPLLNR
jgi:hypothetical protein